ncbi:pyridoxal-phosphate dependent enzyme [uncultured Methylobacterium sp.]|jgi:L-serine/L-threonine ammonia-lyase|uniref:pyridoxal-phosphate dependent enzyme n=1 Tax=uncultured Methylobacterium sp. TaxID=157278 RepID=UPI002629B39C|nr:pyridoxal-phosphate dependent enzyme [uncultured Methylobacterium sp.]
MPLHIATPLIESRPLSLAAGCEVWAKMEALQPSGSFKIRGIGAACAHHAAHGKRRFVSSSGGNAGLAVAYAGRRLGIPVTVVVPETTSATARELIAREEADLVVHGASWQEANARALALVDAETAFLHPFDDPLLWAGHASMIDEAVAAGLPFDAVVVSVGGGGLMAGVAEGLARHGRTAVPIVAVETEGAASLAAAIRAGAPVELPAITSLATSLGAKRVCDRAFRLTRTRPVHSVTVTDGAAVAACTRFLADHRVLVEPACGAALAVLYDRHEILAPFRRVLAIACGGATATVGQLQAWQAAG